MWSALGLFVVFLVKHCLKAKPLLSQSFAHARKMCFSVIWVKQMLNNREEFCTMLVELVNFERNRLCCGMGVKNNQLPLSIFLQGKSQGTARRCLPVQQSPKNPTRAWLALLLGHCRSLQLFLDMALRQERDWKGREHQLCSCRQHLLSLSAGGWGSTKSGWQEAEHAWRSCLCQEVILSFEVWLEMQLLEGSSADKADTKLLFKAEQLI